MSGLIGGSGVTLKKRVQEFRASGTFTVPSGLKTVDLFMVGGGSGGTNGIRAGLGGNVVEISYDVSGKATCAVVIGAGGASAAPGGDTTFDGVAIAKGGSADGMGQSATLNPVPYRSGKYGFGGHGSANSLLSIPTDGGAVGGATVAANTGGGAGNGNTAGGSGYLRVEWYE